MSHVLGVTSDSLAYICQPLTGHPLTRWPYEVSTVTCVNGQSMAYVGMLGPVVLQEDQHESTGNQHFEVSLGFRLCAFIALCNIWNLHDASLKPQPGGQASSPMSGEKSNYESDLVQIPVFEYGVGCGFILTDEFQARKIASNFSQVLLIL